MKTLCELHRFLEVGCQVAHQNLPPVVVHKKKNLSIKKVTTASCFFFFCTAEVLLNVSFYDLDLDEAASNMFQRSCGIQCLKVDAQYSCWGWSKSVTEMFKDVFDPANEKTHMFWFSLAWRHLADWQADLGGVVSWSGGSEELVLDYAAQKQGATNTSHDMSGLGGSSIFFWVLWGKQNLCSMVVFRMSCCTNSTRAEAVYLAQRCDQELSENMRSEWTKQTFVYICHIMSYNVIYIS